MNLNLLICTWIIRVNTRHFLQPNPTQLRPLLPMFPQEWGQFSTLLLPYIQLPYIQERYLNSSLLIKYVQLPDAGLNPLLLLEGVQHNFLLFWVLIKITAHPSLFLIYILWFVESCTYFLYSMLANKEQKDSQIL